jgi:hypothetical protein
MKPCLKCIHFIKERTKHTVILICGVNEKPCVKSLTQEGSCGLGKHEKIDSKK